jgi:hypothetical protein
MGTDVRADGIPAPLNPIPNEQEAGTLVKVETDVGEALNPMP